MASESDYLSAIARVKAGTANQRDYEMCETIAKNVGSLGDKAREALRSAGVVKPAAPLDPAPEMKALGKLLIANGVNFTSSSGSNPDDPMDRLCGDGYFYIEVTQMFLNSKAALTYMNKVWMSRPFAPGQLGRIGITIHLGNCIFLNAYSHVLPAWVFRDGFEGAEEIIDLLIAQDEYAKSLGVERGLDLNRSAYFGTMWVAPAQMRMSIEEYAWNFIQLFAMTAHHNFRYFV